LSLEYDSETRSCWEITLCKKFQFKIHRMESIPKEVGFIQV